MKSSDNVDYRWVTTGLNGDYETRHEAIGKVAKYGDWENDRVIPVSERCLVRHARYPEHLGNRYYGDRNHLATKHGVVRINHEALVRKWNGAEQETVESHWEVEAERLYERHDERMWDDGE